MTLAMITDGTSNTAIWSEWLKGKNTKTGRQAVWTATMGYVNSAGAMSPPPLATLQATLQNVASTCQPNVNTRGHLGPEGGGLGS